MTSIYRLLSSDASKSINDAAGRNVEISTNGRSAADAGQVTIRYKCPECGWIGKESEMEGDYYISGDDEGDNEEIWTNWICPSCKCWHNDVDDYEVVIQPKVP